MRTERLIAISALALLLSGGIACGNKDKANVAQAAAKMEHNPAQCPKLDKIKGDFLLQESREFLPKQIDVQDDANQKLLIVTFDGNEQLVVNGEKQPQDNGANLSAACVNDTIHVTGTGPSPSKEFLDFRMKGSDDSKTLIVDRAAPSKATFQYARTNAPLATITSKTRNLIDKLTGKQPQTGLPNPEDKKPNH